MPYLIANFALFQACWFALVAGAAHGLLVPGVLLAGLFLAWELRRSRDARALGLLVCIAIVGGVIIDGGYAISGVVAYRLPAGPLAPWWILGLWVVFALTLTESMGWIRARPLLGSVLAGIAAPLSYWAGERLGAVSFPRGFWLAMGIAAVTWMPAVYLLATLSRRLLPERAAA